MNKKFTLPLLIFIVIVISVVVTMVMLHNGSSNTDPNLNPVDATVEDDNGAE